MKKQLYVLFFIVMTLFFYFAIIELTKKRIYFSEKEIALSLNKIRRFSNYYHNAESLELAKGTFYYNDGSAVINSNKGQVLDLRLGMEILKNELNYNDRLITIAVLSKNRYNSDHYIHFQPMRDDYIDSLPKINFSRYLNILDEYNIKNSYKNFNSCDLAITEYYDDEYTNENVRTIIYPLYYKGEFSSSLMIDVKSTYFFDRLQNSLGYLTYFWAYNYFEGYKYQNAMALKLECSNGQGIHLSFLYDRFLMLIVFINGILLMVINSTIRLYHKVSYIDELTGLHNRGYLKKITTRNESILYLDIDYFKKINDTFGHNVGDDILVHVSKIITQQLRQGDKAFRWGGEEFVLILKNVKDEQELFNIAERIRISIEMSSMDGINVTISLGGNHGSDTVNNKLNIADKMLYMAKEKGRNRSVIFDYNNED